MSPSRLSLSIALTLLCSAAQAGRPFTTEDAGVLAAGSCEWESVLARATASGAPSVRAVSTQLACALGTGWQLGGNLSQARGGGERASGLGLVGKGALWQRGDQALAWAASTSWSRLQGARREWDGALLQLVGSRELGHGFSLHLNGGASYRRAERKTRAVWAGLVEKSVSDSFQVGAEIVGSGSDRPSLGIGARWQPTPGWSVDASLTRGGESPRERLVTLGFKLTL